MWYVRVPNLNPFILVCVLSIHTATEGTFAILFLYNTARVLYMCYKEFYPGSSSHFPAISSKLLGQKNREGAFAMMGKQPARFVPSPKDQAYGRKISLLATLAARDPQGFLYYSGFSKNHN